MLPPRREVGGVHPLPRRTPALPPRRPVPPGCRGPPRPRSGRRRAGRRRRAEWRVPAELTVGAGWMRGRGPAGHSAARGAGGVLLASDLDHHLRHGLPGTALWTRRCVHRDLPRDGRERGPTFLHGAVAAARRHPVRARVEQRFLHHPRLHRRPGWRLRPLIQLFHVTKRWSNDPPVLDDVTLQVEKGEFVWLTGPSGAGKTTLLRLLFCADEPTDGQIIVGGR